MATVKDIEIREIHSEHGDYFEDKGWQAKGLMAHHWTVGHSANERSRSRMG